MSDDIIRRAEQWQGKCYGTSGGYVVGCPGAWNIVQGLIEEVQRLRAENEALRAWAQAARGYLPLLDDDVSAYNAEAKP